MKKNIKEANISRSRPRPRGNDRISPGEGSINPGRKTLPPQSQSELQINRISNKTAGRPEGRTGPRTTWSALPSEPEQRSSSSGGGITYISKPPEQKKPEQKKPEQKKPESKPQLSLRTFLDALPSESKRRLKLRTGGPIDLTSRGKRLKPGGDAESKRKRAAKFDPEARETRVARGKVRASQPETEPSIPITQLPKPELQKRLETARRNKEEKKQIIREFIEKYRKSILK